MKNTKTNVFLASGFLLAFLLPCMVSYAEMMDVVIDGGAGHTGLSSNFQGAWNSTYGYTFGSDLDADGKLELFFGGSWYQNTYIYKIDSRN